MHIPQTERLTNVLATRPIPKFNSWFEVYEFSEQIGLGKVPGNPRVGCPFVLIGNLLERQGVLEKSPKSYPIYLCYRAVDESCRRHVIRYMDEVLRHQHHLDVAIWRLRLIRDFAVWHGGDLLKISVTRVEQYLLAISPENDVVVFRERIAVLRMFYRWMLDQSVCDSNPFESVNLSLFRQICPKCRKQKMIPLGGPHCWLCDMDTKMIQYIKALEARLQGAPTYHQYLFKLYFTYIKRYRINFSSWMESKRLLEILKTKEIPPLLSWRDINTASKMYRESMGDQLIRKGCPFVKIGHMLVELGVLPLRRQDELTRLNHVLGRFGDAIGPVAAEYCQNLIRRKRRVTTGHQVALRLLYFENWISKHHPGKNPFEIDNKIARDYLSQISTGSRDSRHGTLRKFFRWCQYKEICKENPFESIARPIPRYELPICSKEQFDSLIQYLKNPASDPSHALMIALTMFWAFGVRELLYSTFTPAEQKFEIQVFQSPLSYAHKRATRPDVFVLPRRPQWFSDLQDRFVKNWDKTFSHLDWKDKRPLFPPQSGRYRRPMSTMILFEEISKATKMASGKPIPFQILRCTAGHIHTRGADASLLTQLGWSDASAFRYTWVPRKYQS